MIEVERRGAIYVRRVIPLAPRPPEDARSAALIIVQLLGDDALWDSLDDFARSDITRGLRRIVRLLDGTSQTFVRREQWRREFAEAVAAIKRAKENRP